MFIHISSYSKSLNKLFDKNRVGVIHSVFDNTINFLSDDRLIALTSNQGALTPMSIQLDCSQQQFKQLHAKQHDLVYVSSGGLMISSVHFDGKQAKSVDLSYPKFDKDISDKSLIQLKESIENMLVSTNSQGSLNKAYLSLLLQEEKDLNPLEQAFFNKLSLFSLTVDDADLISLVDSFIGFGEGLTPSGDDLICGLLSVLHYLDNNTLIHQFKNLIINQVKEKSSKTTKISREYLLYACEGLFNEYVSTLFKKHQSKQSVLQQLQQISNLGHSSGTDFIVGMYFGLKIGGIQ